MDAIEKRARELLASAYADTGAPPLLVEEVRGGEHDTASDNAALRAIIAALTPPKGFVLVEKSKLADSERLDFLDAMNVALNSHYGTNYGWRLILSPQITRLMCGQQHQGFVGDIDLNDQNAGRTGFPGCREAIDAARPGGGR